jgi:hypothetical protein
MKEKIIFPTANTQPCSFKFLKGRNYFIEFSPDRINNNLTWNKTNDMEIT